VTEVARFTRFCTEVLELELEPFQVKIARKARWIRLFSLAWPLMIHSDRR
jgi:hypothetical protein